MAWPDTETDSLCFDKIHERLLFLIRGLVRLMCLTGWVLLCKFNLQMNYMGNRETVYRMKQYVVCKTIIRTTCWTKYWVKIILRFMFRLFLPSTAVTLLEQSLLGKATEATNEKACKLTNILARLSKQLHLKVEWNVIDPEISVITLIAQEKWMLAQLIPSRNLVITWSI